MLQDPNLSDSPEILVHADLKLAIVTPRGRLNSQEVGRLVDAMLEHPGFEPGMPSLWDLGLCDVSDVSSDEMRRVEGVSRERKEARGRAKVAVVARRDVTYGQSRVMKVIGSADHLEVEVFRDPEAAEAWLLWTEDDGGKG